MAAPPSPERMGEITVMIWEVALASRADGGAAALPPDARWLLEAVALSVPATAARCPRVLATVAPEVRVAVRRLAGAAPGPVTTQARQASQEAGSEAQERAWVTTQEAARALHRTTHAVRAAARRGRLAGDHDGPGGQWRIDRASLEDYRRGHARADHR